MSRIKVLHVLGGLSDGGMASLVMNLLRSLNVKEYKIDFLVNTNGDFFENEAKALGATIHYIPPRSVNFLSHYIKLFVFFLKYSKRYDVVHIHQGVTYLAPLVFSTVFKIKKRIVHNHGINRNYLIKYKYLIRYISKPIVNVCANGFISCSKEVDSHLFYESTIKSHNYILLNNAIDANKYIFNEEKRTEVREFLNISDKTIVLGLVANFLEVKNHKFLIELFEKYNSINSNSILLLIGDGPLRGTIKELVVSKNLTDNVIFLGKVSNVCDYLSSFDIFVMPSFYEGLPLAAIEAQASDLKVLASSSIDSAVDLFGNVIFLDLDDDIQVWINCICAYCHKIRINRLDNLIKSGFDISIVIEQIKKIYN